jgi:hypothetical protein
LDLDSTYEWKHDFWFFEFGLFHSKWWPVVHQFS